MSNSFCIDEINNIVRTVDGRSADRHPGFLVGEPTDPVFRHYTATPERVHYKTEIFNEEVDRAFKRDHRRTLSNATQSTQSTRQSSIFDDAASFNGSVDSSVTTAPSTRFGTVADPAAHMVATMPDRSVHRLCCEFAQFAGCNATFALEEVEAWIDHNMEHLGGQLPPICVCWFCDDIFFDTRKNRLDLITNFRERMEHICTHIRDDHYNVHQIRPDYHFLSHLHDCRLISDRLYNRARSWTESPAPKRNDIFHHKFIPEEQALAQERSERITVTSGVNRREREHNRDSTRKSQPRSRYLASVHVSISQQRQ